MGSIKRGRERIAPLPPTEVPNDKYVAYTLRASRGRDLGGFNIIHSAFFNQFKYAERFKNSENIIKNRKSLGLRTRWEIVIKSEGLYYSGLSL